MSAINDTTLYQKFVVTKYRIGSTQYKREDCSPMLTQVYIKTFMDKYRFRAVKDFFGENASIEAHAWILEQTSN
jgi:hypothetical protein